MTIVLQHRFWDLVVTDERFEVKLTFDGIPERLVVPFAAIKVFFDPSVRYGLQFEDPSLGPDAGTHSLPSAPLGGDAAGATRSTPRKPRSAKKPRADRDEIDIASRPQPALPAGSASASGAKPGAPAPTVASGTTGKSEPQPAAPKSAPSSGAEIVSLDQFRKK